MTSIPRLEGFHNLDIPYEEAARRLKLRQTTDGVRYLPLEYFQPPATPEVAQLYREYMATAKGMKGGAAKLSSTQLADLVQQTRGEVDLFIARPKLNDAARIARNFPPCCCWRRKQARLT
jgi:hypothetical protein